MDLGILHGKEQKWEKSLTNHFKSLGIKQKLYPDGNHLDIAISYFNIGSVYYSIGDYDKAVDYYKKSLQIKRRILSRNNVKLATSYLAIGLSHEKAGRFTLAVNNYEKAEAIYRLHNHPDMTKVRYRIQTIIKN
ncbi:unnamed protein product [Didymodactylos carnosus]|uniref:Uncharacterized protein n=1 Tax=Didymodactylos carnosus TaxID=1234261 RepID=A0A815RHD8_9BILA|nr:unnamed protein product [Didymodactylos carnosus]CAF1477476.1 unnamed protein product [Didymodactylos carnosus]CAF3807356.1 unnamed protein product [Didymodactylos carnosus]CAF4343310.1 unnamed protein product [Didymodactylos carnosus]